MLLNNNIKINNYNVLFTQHLPNELILNLNNVLLMYELQFHQQLCKILHSS